MEKIRLLVAGGAPLMKLACHHFRDFYNSRGAEIEVEELDVMDVSELPEAVFAAGPAQVVRLDPDLSADWLQKTPTQALKVNQFGVADCFFMRHGRWEPALLFEQALRDVIIHQGRNLDMRESAYVIGEGAMLRIVGGVALSLGFNRISLVGEETDDLEEQKAWLERLFLGSAILALPADTLTVQTIGASLLINTLDLAKHPEVAADLAYFNFMKRDGLVMDVMALEEKNPMLEEAIRAELRIVPPHEISGQTEIRLAKELGLAELATNAEYLSSWLECLKATAEKNPPSVQ